MKIQFLTVMPSPYQRQLFAEIAALPDVALSVLYFTGGAHDREWKLPDFAPFETVLEGRTFHRLWPSAHWNADVMAHVDGFDADVVVISDYSVLTAQYAMRKRARQGKPFVFWGEMPGFTQRGKVGMFLRQQLQAPLARAEAIVGIGSVAEKIYQGLFPGMPVHNIPYFCDLASFQAAGQRKVSKDTVDILFSGQMIERKGFDLLLAAFDRIGRDHAHLRLMILGGGPQKADYEAMVPADLKDRVVFLGHTAPEKLPDVFAQADIFCLPSRHDGWAVVVNEALGASLPIVVTDTVGAGHDMVVPGKNGFVVPLGDADALANCLDQLAGDAALRQSMAQASKDAIAQWDVPVGAASWKAVAQEVVDRRARA